MHIFETLAQSFKHISHLYSTLYVHVHVMYWCLLSYAFQHFMGICRAIYGSSNDPSGEDNWSTLTCFQDMHIITSVHQIVYINYLISHSSADEVFNYWCIGFGIDHIDYDLTVISLHGYTRDIIYSYVSTIIVSLQHWSFIVRFIAVINVLADIYYLMCPLYVIFHWMHLLWNIIWSFQLVQKVQLMHFYFA